MPSDFRPHGEANFLLTFTTQAFISFTDIYYAGIYLLANSSFFNALSLNMV